jgi:hypothetical protein
MKITFAKICWGLLLVLVLFLIRPVGFILYAYLKDKEAQTTVKTGPTPLLKYCRESLQQPDKFLS